MFTILMSPYCAFIQRSPNPICSNKLLIFLLQKALFSSHLMSLYAIWVNLYSFLVKTGQNLKFLHWAAIVIGNRPVSALLTLLWENENLPVNQNDGQLQMWRLPIHQVTNTRHRIALTKLRLSNHKLVIETGRYSKPFKKPAERTCPVCKIEIEDEYHFLNICPAYQEKQCSLLDYLVKEYRIKISSWECHLTEYSCV